MARDGLPCVIGAILADYDFADARGMTVVAAAEMTACWWSVGIRHLSWNPRAEPTANYHGIVSDLRHLDREPT